MNENSVCKYIKLSVLNEKCYCKSCESLRWAIFINHVSFRRYKNPLYKG
jgi:hypothetical protein